MWIIYHNNQTLGPWTANEIREALRDGTINAFDQVSAVGSKERMTVIDVDTIFSAMGPRPDDAAPPLTSGLKSLSEIEIGPQQATKTKLSHRAPQPPVIQEKTELSQSQDAPTKVLDQDFGGILENAATKVQEQLTQVIQEKTRVLGKEPQKSELVEEKRASQEPGAVLGYFLIDASGKQIGPVSGREIYEAWYQYKIDESLMVQKGNSPRIISMMAFVTWWTKGQAALLERSEAPKAYPRSKSGKRLPRWLPYLVIFVVAIAGGYYFALNQLRLKTNIVLEPVNDKPSEKPQPSRKKDVSLLDSERNNPLDRGRLGQSSNDREGFLHLSEARLHAGKVVKVGPLTFPASAVNECDSKCAIPMQDPESEVVEIRFFKAAFADKLRGRREVYITGLMSQEGVVIYPSKVE